MHYKESGRPLVVRAVSYDPNTLPTPWSVATMSSAHGTDRKHNFVIGHISSVVAVRMVPTRMCPFGLG